MNNNINTASMLRVGTVLHGTYRIESYLASGGFGNTYRVKNIEFDEIFAIKEFFVKGVCQRDENNTTISVSNTENIDSFSQQREKFKKEARRLRSLSNLHIVKVYDLFEENGTAYYVMDYVDGDNLSTYLKLTNLPLPEEKVRKYLSQILDGLEGIHAAGIWHLDLKPANIMVDKQGVIKLIDFGASKQQSAVGGATASTGVSYTKGYAPSEQMAQNYDKFGPWTDFYALGATLFKLLTNQEPPSVTDISEDETVDKHIALPMPNISIGMKKLVIWFMQANRLKRPNSVIEIKKQVDKGYEDETQEETIPLQTQTTTSTSQSAALKDNKNIANKKSLVEIGKERNSFAPFSFKGRIGRLHYFFVTYGAFSLLGIIFGILIDILGGTNPDESEAFGRSFGPFSLVLFIFACYVSLTQSTRRCHDVGHSGWYQFIPFYWFVLLSRKGEAFDNKFGTYSTKVPGVEKSKRKKVIFMSVILLLVFFLIMIGNTVRTSGVIDESSDSYEVYDSVEVDTALVDTAVADSVAW